jgi:DNA-binding HxlR family transcriptional regulator
MLHLLDVIIKRLYQVKKRHKLRTLPEALHMILRRLPVTEADTGSHAIMIAHHIGKMLDEPKRKRWMQILLDKDNLPGISEKMLSQQLKELEKDGLIKKEIIARKPYRVQYQLTPSGKEFGPFYRFASKWGISYLKTNGIEYEQDQHLYK